MKIKPIISALILVLSLQNYAQDNVFLNRDFWSNKPSVEDIDVQLKAGHDITQANSDNFDAVVYAILQEAPNETIQYIQSKAGNDVNKLTHDGRTYIFWAAYKGNTEIMQYLLKKGAKMDITDDKGNTILNFAAGSGQTNTKVYDICLAHGANLKSDLTPSGANALLLAAPFDADFKLIDYFTSKGLDIQSVDANGNGVFNYVAKTGNVEMLNQLLKKGVTGNNQAFIFAVYGTRSHTNNLDFYTYLEGIGLNPNTTSKEGETPLHILAARSKDLDLIRYFIKKGVDVNQADADGNTAFLNAAYRNNLEVITILNKQVKDINTVNKKGESALALALKSNTFQVVDFLIKNKAEVSVIDANGNNIIAYAMDSFNANNQKELEQKIALIKANGIDISKPQANGNTLFHLAVLQNNLDLVKWVNTYPVNVNAKNSEGNTALHLAAMRAKNSDILKYLVSIGAKTDAVTEFDETAFDLASENEILKSSKSNLDFLK